MKKLTLLSLFMISAFLLAGCNDFLSAPPGSVDVNLVAAPTAVPGSVDCAISWKTNVDTKHILEYGTATGVYTVATPLSSAESKDHSVSLASLLPATTYYYRVRSYYRTSQEENSAEFSFTTGTLTTITVTDGPTLTVGQTSCDLSWTTNVPTKHAIEYGTSSGAFSASTVLSGTASATHAASITGLSPSTTYYYRIRSTYQNGLEGLSAESSFTTLAGAASLSFSSAPAATPALTSASIAYTTNYPTVSSIEYGTASGVYTESLVLDSSAPTHTRVLSGLAEGTTYYYVVHCYSASNGSIVSPQYSFTTTSEAAPTLAQRLRGIWLVGGCSGINWATAIQQIDLYDPVTATWYSNPSTNLLGKVNLPTPVSFAAVGIGTLNSTGHRILVIVGGFDTSINGVPQSIVQRYDVDSETWLANGTPMPAARANVIGAVRNNNLYVIGGTTGNATGVAYGASNTEYEYNIGTNSWTTLIAAAAAGSEKATVSFNDTILYSGGRTGAAALAATHDALIPAQPPSGVISTGIAETVLPVVRTGHVLAMYRNSSGSSFMVMLGGFSALGNTPTNFILNGGSSGTLVTAATVQYLRYPFSAGCAWTNYSELPVPCAFGATAVYGDTLYFFGGTATYLAASGRSAAYSSDVSTIGVTSNAWNPIGTMPVGRYGHAAVRFE